jgi:hypothetical protein
MATTADIISFRSNFAELNSATDAQIASSINVTDVMLGDGTNWPSQKDFALARLMYIAHQVTLQLVQAANAAGGTGFADIYVDSIRFGERNIRYAQRKGVIDNTNLDVEEAILATTNPGQMFLELRERNIIPVALVPNWCDC